MALKPNRIQPPYGDNIKFHFTAAAERGGIASVLTSANTGYPGDPANAAQYASDPTVAKVIGLLLQDVVSYDTNRLHDNWEKSGFQERVGKKVNITHAGEYHTNMVPNGVTPAAQDPAYLAANGCVSNVQATSGGGANKAPRVGTFQTGLDANGFIVLKLELD